MSDRFTIRPAEARDWPAIWGVLEPVFRAGETYAVPVDIDEAAARAMWLEAPAATYVAEGGPGQVLATYYIKSNYPGPGSHVCNCGYVVAESSRGRGLAGLMCAHSQDAARELGYLAMQYNLVVATNEGAVRLWKKHGFQEVGRIPKAFRHPARGLVDALVMHKWLGP